MNESNLIPNYERTPEERKEIARKGGIASGESRRRRKTLKEELLALLEINDNNNKISLAVLQKALNGDIQAFTTIRDTIGEKPKDEIDLKNKISYEDALKKVNSDDEY
jgi:hypothetical protein